MRFLQRPSGVNGVVSKFDLYARTAETDPWTKIVTGGTLAPDAAWQMVSFDPVDALQVKFQVLEADSDTGSRYAAAAEIRFTVPAETHEHSYDAVVTAPTCTQGGYTTYTCACGDSYIAGETEPLGHVWNGTHCQRCGAVRANPFTDVPEPSFYIDAVLWAVEQGITTGATPTTFNPGGELLRGQVVTMLWRAAGCPEPTSDHNPFTDVKEGDFFYKAVLWAVEQGITTGVSATAFNPTGVTNRAQAVTFLWRAAGQPEPNTAEHPFADVAAGSFYEKAVLWAVEQGVTNGVSPDTFGISQNCNRAQMVTFLYRTMT